MRAKEDETMKVHGMNLVFKMVGGSIAIYVAMAACSASGGPATGFGPPGSSKPSGSSGGTSVTNPVPTASADSTQSGSRLKAMYNVGSDGSKTFVTFHDTQLNADCSFGGASDGSTRCLPSGAQVGGFFSDPQCSQPLGFAATGCVTPVYAVQYETICRISIKIFPVTGTFNGSVYTGNATSCTAYLPVAANPSDSFYNLGPEVSPSSFVQATLQAD